MTNDKSASVPVKDKYAMDIKEASEYFGLGEKKLRQIISENLDAGFVLQNGVKYLVKRKKFEQYLEIRTAI